jgi:two-component system, NtrC family, sensor histidine kinase KinB
MLGLRAKILLGFGGMLVIMLIVSAVSSFVFWRYSGATQQMLEQDFNSVTACQEMARTVELCNDVLEKSLLAGGGDPAADAASLAALSARFNMALAMQRASMNLPGEAEATDAVEQVWKEYLAVLPTATDPARSLESRRDAYNRIVQPKSQQVLDGAERITDRNRENVTSTQGEAQTLARHARFAVVVLAVVAVVFAVAFSLAIGQMILRPVGVLTRSVQEIRQGNLDASVPIRSRDELGHLAAAFNEMAEQLRFFRRLDHEKIIRTQRTTQLAIDSLPDPVIVLNPQGSVELTNDAARRCFPLAPGVASNGQPPWLRQLVSRLSTDAAAIDPPTGYDTGIHLRSDGGDERYLLPRAVPIRDEQGQLIGATVVLNDVTGLRRLDQMKSGLLSLVSHELKTPLTSMRMILHLLADGLGAPSVSAETRDLLITARDDSDRLHQIVENLLDMSRIESGKVLMELKPIHLDELIARSVNALRPMFDEHRVQLLVDQASTLTQTTVLADATRVGHVFANLLWNALRYTPADGTVRISATVPTNSDSFVEVAVGDTGSGIPRQHLPRVFEKFFRVPGQSGGGGAGLGLAIAKDIVEAHGGRITIDSEESRGTTVRFTLQTASPPSAAASPPPQPAEFSAP